MNGILLKKHLEIVHTFLLTSSISQYIISPNKQPLIYWTNGGGHDEGKKYKRVLRPVFKKVEVY